jgi:hypothetical protein
MLQAYVARPDAGDRFDFHAADLAALADQLTRA